jgi:hypothetical protein
LAAVKPAISDVPNNLIRIGVLTDFSGFTDQVGQGSVVAAQLAVDDFASEAGDLRVEILAAKAKDSLTGLGRASRTDGRRSELTSRRQ